VKEEILRREDKTLQTMMMRFLNSKQPKNYEKVLKE